MTKRKVVVTGLGLVSPIGNTVDTSWQNALAGKSGVGQIEHFDVTDYTVTIAGCVKDFDAETYMEPKEARRRDQFVQYGALLWEIALA